MRYAGLKKNDIVDCEEGICVSLWTQGCPFHCKGCHNPETWDFMGGMKVPHSIFKEINKAINENGIQRNFSVLGGEPLCPANIKFVRDAIRSVRKAYPTIKIYVWTGYTLEELKSEMDHDISEILKNIDVLIDGRFIESRKNLRLKLRGSDNQRILYKGKDF